MAKLPTSLTAASGEHFVVYELSRRGYCAALTRAGSPGVDVLVTSPTGERTASIQVKTARSARSGVRKPDWSWDVGKGSLMLKGDNVFYALVDLKASSIAGASEKPDVYIVPASIIFSHVKPDFSRFRFWMYDDQRQNYLERWDFIEHALLARI